MFVFQIHEQIYGNMFMKCIEMILILRSRKYSELLIRCLVVLNMENLTPAAGVSEYFRLKKNKLNEVIW